MSTIAYKRPALLLMSYIYLFYVVVDLHGGQPSRFTNHRDLLFLYTFQRPISVISTIESHLDALAQNKPRF